MEDRLTLALFRRPDGTFVVDRNGLPFHLTPDEPGFDEVAAYATEHAVPLEPPPEVPAWAADLLEPSRTISALAFMERLTPDERIAIRQAARENVGLEDWLDMLRAAQVVDLDDHRTTSGMNAMVNAGLLTAARRDAILA